MRYVYMLRAGQAQYKVGIASNVYRRIKELQTSNPNRIDLVMSRLLDNATEVERMVHQRLHSFKMDGGTEWFAMTCEQAVDIAVFISSFAEPDITEAINNKRLLDEHRLSVKEINKALKLVIANINDNAKKAAVPQADKVVVPKVKHTKSDADIAAEAIDIVFKHKRASTSLLQRELRLGYGKAARILYRLEELGLVTESDGSSKPRQVIGTTEHASAVSKNMLGL